MRACYIYLRN